MSLLGLVLLSALTAVQGQLFDATRVSGEAGANVVVTSLALIQDTGFFRDDNRFLRRLAYVESRDGVDINTFRPGYFGGLWQIDEDLFNFTRATVINPDNLGLYLDLIDEFGIDFAFISWEDLLSPIFSALTAAIYLETITDDPWPLPDIGDIAGQGQFWLDHFSSDPTDTLQEFVDAVNELEEQECPIRGLDLAFVFDSSGSVGQTNFQFERQFAIDVTNTFNVGPENTRIANVVYSGIVRVSFYFDTFENQSDVTDALGAAQYFNIENPPGSGRGTNTAGALNVLREDVFSETNGARAKRFGIPRVAVVITDGRSNVNRQDTIPAAQRLNDDGVIVFGVGVGGNIVDAEVDAIASNEELSIRLANFDISEFANLQKRVSTESCDFSVPIEIATEIEGTLLFGESSFFQYQIPADGLTLSLQTSSGRSVMYASDKVKNPNSAFYDYRYESSDGGGLFVSVELLGGGRRRREDFTDSTLYVTVEGLDEQNEFSLLTTFGNTSSCAGLLASTLLVAIAALCSLF